MFRLTREVRFTHDADSGLGQQLRLQVTLQSALDPKTSYLRDIKDIDQRVRERVVGVMRPAPSAKTAFGLLHDSFPGDSLHAVTLVLNPLLSLTQLREEYPMNTRLSRRFDFCAAHRLHNPALSDEENRRRFGKCNNPHGHGHNYEMQVTLRGKPSENGLLVDVPAFERVVQEQLITKWDHKNLNIEVPEFAQLIPTVENIAMVAYQTLQGHFEGIGGELAAVTVWETAKTWCEYSE
jgi:6-pyruvoyltetrahydropterin/6-carboxytetrahydropterin synthase